MVFMYVNVYMPCWISINFLDWSCLNY